MLGLLVLHETLHHENPPPDSPADPGTENSLSEETFNTFASSLIYAQLLAEDPALVRQPAHLTIVQNTYLLALLNTLPARDPAGIGPLNPAPAASVFPSGASYPDFASFVRSRYEATIADMPEDSPGTPYLWDLVTTFTGNAPPDDASFASALAHVEQATVSRDVIDAQDLLTVASALSLDGASGEAAAPALIRQAGISPTLRWCASMGPNEQGLAAARY